MSKTRATQAADLYSTARENPYVQRLVEDEELRDSLKNAFEAAKGAYGRATSNGSAVKAVTSDKKVQRDLHTAAENLRDVSERLRAPKKRKKSRLGRIVMLALVGAVDRPDPQRGCPQDRARRALRCRGGVRVHEHHFDQRFLRPTRQAASSVARVRSTPRFLRPCLPTFVPPQSVID